MKSIKIFNFFPNLQHLFVFLTFIALMFVISCNKAAISMEEEVTELQKVIEDGVVPNDLTTETIFVRNTLGRVGGNVGATISSIYVTESGSGNYSGTSWTNAQRGTNLRTLINGISDASSSKVYMVLVGAGTYKATTGSDVNLSFSMKNHTAIIGGFDDAEGSGIGSWTRSAGSVTTFDGDIGTTGDRSDNTKRIFVHGASGVDHTAVLYGVEIRNANANGANSDSGGGMYNKSVNPTLVGVTFIRNYVTLSGGGIYNDNSSPLIINSSFISNEVNGSGGGMYNVNSSPIVVNTTFANNISSSSGGAIHNSYASIILINVTMVGNNSSFGGGFSSSIGSASLSRTVHGNILVNSVVWGNIVGRNPDQIALGNDININLTLANTILQGDTNAINIGTPANSFNIINDGVIVTDPSLGSLTNSGSRHMPISTGSSAESIGYHVKIDGRFANDNAATGATLYYSEDDTNWFTNITSGGLAGSVTPPSSAVYLTEYDVTGQERTDRPDAGAYEAR